MVEAPDTLSAARDLAACGFRVFPLPLGRKDPPIEEFQHKATCDARRVESWFTDIEGASNDRNIGIATGAGIVVLDVDCKPGQRGDQSLFELEMQGLPTDTFTVRTPSGGTHLYFRAGRDVGNSIGKIAPNVDVRSAGGYVVAPGSETAAGRYVITADRPLAEAPDWLLDRCGAPRERSADAAVPLVELDRPDAVARAAEFLRVEADPSIKGAGGDVTAYRVAAAVKDFGISEPLCLELMLDHWNDRGSPSWAPDRLAVKVANAYHYGHNAPGSLSAEAEFGSLPAVVRDASAKPQDTARIRLSVAASRSLQSTGKPLVRDLLECGAMSVMYGDSNVGKSFVALDLAFHVSTGAEWNGRKVRKGGVFYVVCEGGRGIYKRADALMRHHAPATDPLFDLYVRPVDLLNPAADVRKLVQAAEAAADDFGAPVELIVIDTLSRALAGGDENSSTDMGAFVRNIDRLRTATGAHVLVVHHTGKDAARGARGHSLLRAATDTELEVADGTLRARKQRDIENGAELNFALRVVQLGDDEEGRPVTSCVVDWRIAPEFSDADLPETGAAAEASSALAYWGEHVAHMASLEGTTPAAWSFSTADVVRHFESRTDGAASRRTVDRWLQLWRESGAVRRIQKGIWRISEAQSLRQRPNLAATLDASTRQCANDAPEAKTGLVPS